MLEGTTLWIAAVSNPCNLKARHVMQVAEGLRMSAGALARACSLSPPSKEVRWRMAFSTISREDDSITGYDTICGTARREPPARLHAQRRMHNFMRSVGCTSAPSGAYTRSRSHASMRRARARARGTQGAA